MSEDLKKLRYSDSKGMWNLLKEGYDSSKIGNIAMKEWLMHFSGLFAEQRNEICTEEDEDDMIYSLKVEDLDRDFTLQEVREAIFYHLRFNKASGPDGICNEILKWGLEWLQQIILILFNQLWRKDLYPQMWNEIFLIPAFKGGSFSDPNNYRGIAVMSCLDKLFCILVNTRLYAWAEKNQKLSKWQGGFRRRMGCDTQCFRLMSAVLHQFSKPNGYRTKHQGRVFACFIDFKKAYDSINHELLIVEEVNGNRYECQNIASFEKDVQGHLMQSKV